jgi:transposase
VVVFGIDSHKQSLAIAAVDEAGRLIDEAGFANSDLGHAQLAAWALAQAGEDERRFAIEGARGYAAALTERLLAAGEVVVEVPASLTRRERRHLRGGGRSDARDALAIARAALAEPALPELSPHDAMRDLKLAYDFRLQLVRERTRTANRLHVDLLVLEPGYERRIRHLASKTMLDRAARLLRDHGEVRAQLARRRLARIRSLDRDIAALAAELRGMVEQTQSGLVQLCGISYLNAARILGEVGDVRRFATKDAFAAANGTAPVPASSGSTQRMRLNRGGNRRLNYAIHIMALTQSRCDARARAYLARRRAEGKTPREAMRALKRRLSDVVYQQLRADLEHRAQPASAAGGGVGGQRRRDA